MSVTAVLPDNLAAPLRAVAARQQHFRIARAMIFAFGLCAAIALVAVLLLGGFPHLPPLLRWGIAGLAWIAMTWTLWRFLHGSLTSVDLLSAAGTVETLDAAHEEMLSSAVQFSTDEQARQIASSELVDHVIDNATQVAGQIDARQIITLRTLIGAMMICLPALVVWLVLWPLMPNTLALGVRRTIMPWSKQMPLSAMHLTVSPGTITIGQGGNIVITARDNSKSAPLKKLHLQLALRYADGRDSVHPMTPTGPRSYRHTFVAVQTSFQYRIISRRGQSRWYGVHVIERPAISGLTIRYTYPPYTHMPPHQVTGVDGSIRGIRGTQVSVTVHTTEPLSRRSALKIAASPAGPGELARLHHTAGTAYRAVFTLEASTHYQVDLRNMQHIANQDNRVWPIAVYADPLPVVHVISPRGVVRARPDDVIPIHYAATDRFGITSLRVRVKAGAAPSMSYPIPLGTLGGRRYTGTWQLNIANQLLAGNEPHAKAIIYRLVVQDNCQPAHQTGLSGEHEIKIDPNLAMSYQARRDAVLYRRFSAAIETSIRKLNQARQNIANLQRVPTNQHFNARAMHTANHAQNLIQQSAQNLTSTAARMHRGVYRQAARAVRHTAKTSMASAAKNVALATFENPKLTQKRSAQLAAAQQKIAQALTQLHAAASRLAHKAGIQVIADSVKALAQRQASVSRQLSINPTSRRAMAQQRQIENQLQRLIKQHPTLQKPTMETAGTAVHDLKGQLQKIMAIQRTISQTVNAKLHRQQAINELKTLQARQAQLNQAIHRISDAQKHTPAGRQLFPISRTAMQTAENAIELQHAAAAHIAQRQIAAQLQREVTQLQRAEAASQANAKEQKQALAAQTQAQALVQAAGQAAAPVRAANKTRLQQLGQRIANAAGRMASTTSNPAARQSYRQAQAQASAARQAAADNNIPALREAIEKAAANFARGAQAQMQSATKKANPRQLAADAQQLAALAREQREMARQTAQIARQLAAARQARSMSVKQSTQAATALSRASSTASRLERQTALGAPNLAAAIAQARRQMLQAHADQQSTNQMLSRRNHVEAAIHQQAAIAHAQAALADLQQGMSGNGVTPAASHNDQIAGEMSPGQAPTGGATRAASSSVAPRREPGGQAGLQAGQSEYQRLMATAAQLQRALAAGHTAAQGNSNAAQMAAAALSQAEQALGSMGKQPSSGPSATASAAASGQTGPAGTPGQGAGMGSTQDANSGGHLGNQGSGIEADKSVGSMPPAVSALGISPAQWVKLGALRQQHLLNSARQSIPPGYRQMVRDYYERIANFNADK